MEIYFTFGIVCMYVCVFPTIMGKELKFGMELGFHPEKVIANIRPGHPHPRLSEGLSHFSSRSLSFFAKQFKV